MLFHLAIRDIALIEHLEIDFAPGLNVLTGETGAGKSIIIDAVNLAIGGRAVRGSFVTAKPRPAWMPLLKSIIGILPT